VLNPEIGTLCVAQCIEDKSWYRSKILALDSQEAEVLFVDYGKKQKSQLSDLKAIEKTFLTLPPQAYHCCLAAIKIQDEWPQNCKTYFEDYWISVDLTATFTQRTTDGKYRVRLTYINDDCDYVEDLNALFGAPSTVNAPQFQFQFPFNLSSNPVNVTVAWFYHSCKFYLAVPSTNNYYQVRQLCDEFFVVKKKIIFHFMFS
jgi:tudor domain-containing protein 1/4/6/7